MALTLAQLQAVLATSSGQLDLAGSELDSAAANALFTHYLPDGRLTLRDATTSTTAPDSVTVTGVGVSGSGPFAKLRVTAVFTLTGEVSVTGLGDATWSFVDAFPSLAGTMFDTLRFDTPTLFMGTTPERMTFDGTLRVDGHMALVTQMMPGVTHLVTGEITMVTGPAELPTATVPSVMLLGPASGRLDLGIFAIEDVRYEIYAVPGFNYDVVDYRVSARFVVTGEVTFRAGGTTHQVHMGAEITDWGDRVLLRADFSEAGNVTLGEVAALAGLSSLVAPDAIGAIGLLKLTEVVLMMTAGSPPAIDHITLRVETEAEWTIHDLITVQKIDLIFRVDNPGPSGRVDVSASGLFGIGTAGTLELSVDFGQGKMGGGLREGESPLKLREVYEHFTDDPATHLPDLEVVTFDFALELPLGERALGYDAVLDVGGDWQVADQFSVTDLGLRIGHHSDTQFVSRASLLIDAVPVVLTAEYDSALKWTFSGETGPYQQIPIGRVIDDLASRFGAMPLPAPISRLVVENLGASFTTGNGKLQVTGEARFPIDTTEIDIAVDINTHARSYGGRLRAELPGGRDLRLGMRFDRSSEAGRFAAAASKAQLGSPPALKELVGALSPTAAAYVPDGVNIDLRGLLLAVSQAEAENQGQTDSPTETGSQAEAVTSHLFALDIAATIDLSKLPVVGEHLKGDQIMGFDPLRVTAASGPMLAAEVTAINAVLSPDLQPMPERDVAAGYGLDGVLRLGPLEAPLALPVAGPAVTAPTPPDPTRSRTSDKVLWHKIQRNFGPVHIERAGLAYRHPNHVALLLDASISVAGLTLALDGLRVELAMDQLTALPSFGLSGMAVAYAEGPVEVSGAFLTGEIDYEGKHTAYSGKALIRTEDLTVGAIGSYMQLNVGPSLFVYAFLNHPIGGPPFFFVRGLAAGFGYNRRMLPPSVDKLADFPLVAEAIGTRPSGDLANELQALEQYLPPSPGDLFLAAGVRFTTFEMIDSFLLLVAGFGHRFELDLLGLSTLTLPVPAGGAAVTPVAEMQLALRATLVPEDGWFTVTAQLTPNSYLLSKACHLRGGFAFSTWFGDEHNGDFVITAGGYHPHFAVPAHYPVVPRLAFDWQVTPQLSMTGTAYYALTPSALMVGGTLSATYHDGRLHAWFDASMDFLIAWQPYHYEADFHIAVGASYTFKAFGKHTITAHVGADVHLYGPEFGGSAHIDIHVISFTISFGQQRPARPSPVSWSTFRANCLPEADKITTVTVRGGAIASVQGTGGDLGLLDPSGLELVTESVIPSTSGRLGPAGSGQALPTGGAPATFGVSPLGRKGNVTAEHRIQITRNGGPAAAGQFTFEPVRKNLPAALWNGELKPDITAKPLAEGLLVGYIIRPAQPSEPPAPSTLTAGDLRADTPLYTVANAFDRRPPTAFTDTSPNDQERRELIDATIGAPDAATARAALVRHILPGAPINLGGFAASDFHETPRVSQHA